MLSPSPVPGPVGAGAAGKTWERLWEAAVELLPAGVSICPPWHPLSIIQFWLGTGQLCRVAQALLKAGDVLNLSLGEQAGFVPRAGVREAFPARVSEGSMETRT